MIKSKLYNQGADMSDSQTFCKTDRLLKSQEFTNVFNNTSKKIHSEHLLIFLMKKEQSNARLGLAITKKKIKNAVERNRLKRLTREFFRTNKHRIFGVDVVLIVKRKYNKEFDISKELDFLFRKITELYPSK